MPKYESIEFEHHSIGVAPSHPYDLNTMVHDFHATTISNLTDIEACLAELNLTYRMCFTGHPAETAESIRKLAPIRKMFFSWK